MKSIHENLQPKYTIYLIDDDPVQEFLLEQYLNNRYTPTELPALRYFQQIETALQSLQQDASSSSPVLILLDLIFADKTKKNGFDFLNALQDKALSTQASAWRLSVLTGSTRAMEKNWALSYDIVERYVIKPVLSQHLNQIFQAFEDSLHAPYSRSA